MTSGTVDIPTVSAPMARTYLYSAGVSKVGPVRPAYTPVLTLISNSFANAFQALVQTSSLETVLCYRSWRDCQEANIFCLISVFEKVRQLARGKGDVLKRCQLMEDTLC